MKYCEHCGKEIPLFEKCSCEAAKKAQGESKWTTPMKATIIGVIVVAILVPILIVSAVYSQINAFDYVEVTFDGNHGYGRPYVSFDDRALISKIIGEAPNEMNFEEYFKWEMQYAEYYDAISYSCDKTERLSNGDTVTVTISATGDDATKIKGGSKTFKVENLPEAEAVDVFKDIEFEITGVSGYAHLEIINNSENPFAKACRFSVDNRYNLKNGDKVTIMIEYDLDDSIRYNAVPKETVKVITVSGLPSYLTDVSQLPNEDTLKNIAEQFLNDKKASTEDDWLFSYSDFNYYKAWLLITKPDAQYAEYAENCLVFCVSYKEYLRGEYNKTVYSLRKFSDIVVQTDGSVFLNHDDVYGVGSFTDEAKTIEKWEEDYIVTEISLDV